MKLYHYSATKFDSIDTAKCDGFWMTDIAPENKDMLMEIGATGLEYVAIVELDVSGEELTNGSNDDVADQLESEECDYMKNIYDGFSDYAVANTELVKIIEWVKL